MATWQESTPCETSIYDESKKLNISKLNPDEKARVWLRIQADAPELADLLRCDEFKLLLDVFGGDIEIERSALEEVGRSSIEE